MSQDPKFSTDFSHNPSSSGYTSNNNSFNTTGSLNHNTNSLNNNKNSFNITVTDDRSEILTWLSPLEPHLRHSDLESRRVTKVGDWLLRTEELETWQSCHGGHGSQKAIIFCSGNPGVGKTYISSLVVDTLCDEAAKAGEDIAVACFYFDFAAQKEQSAAGTLGALLKQVVSGFEKIPKEIVTAFRGHKKVIGGRKLQFHEMVKVLGSLSSTRRTFFCLDALDESTAPDRAKILPSLRDIIKISPTTRVFLTGRSHVGSEVGKHLPHMIAHVSISPRLDDIIRYIHKRLEEDTTTDAMNETLKEEIVKKIPETVSEIFLLVSLNLDAILQETTIRGRRERLRVITDGSGLEGACGATLDRIQAHGGPKSRLGMAALIWICHAERPLGAEELCQALAVEMGWTDYDPDNVASIRTVLSCSQGLVEVDKEGVTVRLIHYTLQEYLTHRRNLFKSPHATIAEACLTYLNSEQVMALSGTGPHGRQRSPFLEYSALYRGAHMKKEFSDGGKTLALKLFKHYECHISIGLLLEHIRGWHALNSSTRFYKFTELHHASIFGLVEVATALLEMDGVDTNRTDETGATPLVWAARSGQVRMVKLLLGQKDINPDNLDGQTRTPISWAARYGNEAVVKLLLAREDVNPDRQDWNGQTPISWAAMNGHEAVVKLLLARADVNPDRQDQFGQIAISWAAENGHEAVVKLLLARADVNPNRRNLFGQIPILSSSKNGHEAVVKLLLAREDVNPHRQDWNGQTPISWAAKNGHEGVVKLLLALEDVNPDRQDWNGQTPISWAAKNGHEAVVKLLLARADVNPDRQDQFGQTPISWAAENGHEVVVKLLLRRGDSYAY